MHEHQKELGNLEAALRLYAGAPIPPSLPDAADDFPLWKELQRSQFLDLLRPPLPDSPTASAVLDTAVEKGLIREEIRLGLGEGMCTAATLLRPEKQSAPLPAMLALHDHGGYYYHGRKKLIEGTGADEELRDFRLQYYSGRSWATDLARRGYVVLVPDAFYFGERKLDLESIMEEMRGRLPHPLEGLSPGSPAYIDRYNRNLQFYEALVARHISALPVTWPGILVGDDMRAVDYLSGRPEVDASRIACCGLSLGGFRSALLCGLDERIRCAVVAGWMCTFASLTYRNLRDHTFMLYAPHMQQWGDLPDITGLLAPAPLLVQQCMQDDLFLHEGMFAAAKRLEEYYGAAGAPGQLSVRCYDNPHQFNRTMQEEAFTWLDRQLGIA